MDIKYIIIQKNQRYLLSSHSKTLYKNIKNEPLKINRVNVHRIKRKLKTKKPLSRKIYLFIKILETPNNNEKTNK